MQIAVIGVGSFLGKALTRTAAACGHTVIGFGPNTYPELESLLTEFHQVDLSKDAIQIPQNTDAVFYLAQSPYYRDFPQNGEHLFAVNAFGAFKAAQEASAKGTKLFVYASTGNVYQPSFDLLSESSFTEGSSAYAISKLTGESLLNLLKREMQITNLRIFGLFGPGQDKMLPYNLFQSVSHGKPIHLQSNPKNTQDKEGLRISFCYINDAAAMLLRLASNALDGIKVPAILNLAGPESISIKRFASQIGYVINKQPVFVEESTMRSMDLKADISLLRETLNHLS